MSSSSRTHKRMIREVGGMLTLREFHLRRNAAWRARKRFARQRRKCA